MDRGLRAPPPFFLEPARWGSADSVALTCTSTGNPRPGSSRSVAQVAARLGVRHQRVTATPYARACSSSVLQDSLERGGVPIERLGYYNSQHGRPICSDAPPGLAPAYRGRRSPFSPGKLQEHPEWRRPRSESGSCDEIDSVGSPRSRVRGHCRAAERGFCLRRSWARASATKKKRNESKVDETLSPTARGSWSPADARHFHSAVRPACLYSPNEGPPRWNAP